MGYTFIDTIPQLVTLLDIIAENVHLPPTRFSDVVATLSPKHFAGTGNMTKPFSRSAPSPMLHSEEDARKSRTETTTTLISNLSSTTTMLTSGSEWRSKSQLKLDSKVTIKTTEILSGSECLTPSSPELQLDSKPAPPRVLSKVLKAVSEAPPLYLDAEGVSLSRSGELSVLEMHIKTPQHTHTYLLDVHVLKHRVFCTKRHKRMS